MLSVEACFRRHKSLIRHTQQNLKYTVRGKFYVLFSDFLSLFSHFSLISGSNLLYLTAFNIRNYFLCIHCKTYEQNNIGNQKK